MQQTLYEETSNVCFLFALIWFLFLDEAGYAVREGVAIFSAGGCAGGLAQPHITRASRNEFRGWT